MKNNRGNSIDSDDRKSNNFDDDANNNDDESDEDLSSNENIMDLEAHAEYDQ
jgi:hypothetical protein